MKACPQLSKAGKRGDTTASEQEQAAAYLAELSGDLAEIARRYGFDTLVYILDMAREEATHAARRARLTPIPLPPEARHLVR